ncbi:MAG: hypothetical protein DDT32_02163 [Syntrophomonadaceae bacterium]|nr:hypothetical protein [Bacillota bacterium]
MIILLILRAKSVNLKTAAHFALRNTKNCGGEKARAGQEFLSPLPPFLPAPPEPLGGISAFQRRNSCSKKVRTSFSNCDHSFDAIEPSEAWRILCRVKIPFEGLRTGLGCPDGDDLIVSFAIQASGYGEVNSLTLLRTPKYEFVFDEDERGVNVSYDDFPDDEDDLREEIEIAKKLARIRTRHRSICSRLSTRR